LGGTIKGNCGWLSQALLIGCLALSGCNSQDARTTAPIVVEWTTATEINTAGFNLYRSDRVDGEYVKINTTLVPASPDPLRGGKYRYEDVNVEPGKTYSYKLEDVELSGATMQHGPIQATAAASRLDTTFVLVGAGALAILGAGVIAVYVRRSPKIKLSWNKRDEKNAI
jgi:hypothetical protein